MTKFPVQNVPFIHEAPTVQISELQQAIQESTRKLQEVQNNRGQIEKEIIERRKETAQRVELMMEKSKEVDALQQLGRILQEEMQLTELLNGKPDAERYCKLLESKKTSEQLQMNQISLLRQRSETASNKAKSLVTEILEAKKHLQETKAQHMAGRAAVPTTKSKRNQKKK